MIEKLQLMTLMFLSGPRVRKDEKGATATEYSLLVALIALAIIGGVSFFATALDGFFRQIGATVNLW